MKKHSYGKLIGMSLDWLKQMLFRPFLLKKWLMLFIILLLAGYMAGGAGFNLGGQGNLDEAISKLKESGSFSGEMQLPFDMPDFSGSEMMASPQTLFIIIAVLVIILLISLYMLLWMWISANFSFVVIDSVIKNDASLRVPFHKNKPRGNSYFMWNILFSSVCLLVLGAIIAFPVKALFEKGVFSGAPIDIAGTLSIMSGYMPFLAAAGLLFFLIAFFVREFILPIMYKRRIGILKGWGVFLGLFGKNIGEMFKYVLMRLLLSIIAIFFIIVVALTGALALLIIAGIIVLTGIAIHSLMPAASKAISLTVLIVTGIPIFVFLGIVFNALFIPFPLFFRTFSINFLGSLDGSLDLFAPKTQEEIMADSDDSKFKKSMKMVWFAVLLPVLIVAVSLILALAIPSVIGAKKGGFQIKKTWFEDIVRSKKKRKVSAESLKITPRGEIVTVYLKNGNSFEAEIEKESERNIAFRVEGGTYIISRDDILRIER